MTKYTKEVDAKIREQWAAGAYPADIARSLGKSFTAQGVMLRVQFMSLPARYFDKNRNRKKNRGITGRKPLPVGGAISLNEIGRV